MVKDSSQAEPTSPDGPSRTGFASDVIVRQGTLEILRRFDQYKDSLEWDFGTQAGLDSRPGKRLN